jgi:hypothetical protein
MRVLTSYRLGKEGKHDIPIYSNGPWWVVALLKVGVLGMNLYTWADARMEEEEDAVLGDVETWR